MKQKERLIKIFHKNYAIDNDKLLEAYIDLVLTAENKSIEQLTEKDLSKIESYYV